MVWFGFMAHQPSNMVSIQLVIYIYIHIYIMDRYIFLSILLWHIKSFKGVVAVHELDCNTVLSEFDRQSRSLSL